MSAPPASNYGRPPGRVSRRASLAAASLAAAWIACSHPRAEELRGTLAAYDAGASGVEWPGFDPAAVPLALYDAERTYLLRHPSPPEEYERVRGVDDAWTAPGTPGGVRANTDVEIAGVRTALVSVADGGWEPWGTAATLLHEAFHAYQSVVHPEWAANEVDLFTYPVRSAALLELRRLEGAALRRAITAPDSARELCFAHEFLRAREGRFRRLPETAVAYERGSELREGLARYVEARATGGSPPRLPADGFRPQAVRERSYETGHALAVLLDRLAAGWKDSLHAGTAMSLDALLARAIAERPARRCPPAPDEVARTRTVARADIADLERQDRRARSEFENAPGWRIEVAAGDGPLAAEHFDPLNVRVLDDRHVLHTRWIRVTGPGLSAEVLDRPALTRGLPGHPLFAGVDRVWITGLARPEVERGADTIRIEAEGVRIVAVGAELEEGERTLELTARGDGSPTGGGTSDAEGSRRARATRSGAR